MKASSDGACLQQAADVPTRDVRQPAVPGLVEEQRLAVLPQRLVAVHPRTVVTKQRFRHERRGLAGCVGDRLHDVLEEHDLVGGLGQRVEAVVDLGLAGGADLVVRALDLQAERVQLQDDLVAQVGEVVDRRHREVPTLVRRLVAEVAALLDPAGVPGGLDRVDVVVAGVLLGLEPHVVEDVELGLGREERRVGDAGRLQVGLGLRGHLARVAAVRLVGVGVDDAHVDVQRLLGPERVEVGRRQVGDQLHVRLVDRLEAADRGPVEHLALGEELLGDRRRPAR